jgi:phosphatidylinositol 4-kinase
MKIVELMLDSGLPCFTGKQTICDFQKQFVLDKLDDQTAQYFMGLIQNSCENRRTKAYDQFQRLTNGIGKLVV